MDKILDSAKGKISFNHNFQKENMTTRILHIMAGIIILLFAHTVGTYLRSYVYKYGKEEVHVERKKGETPLSAAQSSVQEQKTKLPFIIIGQFVYYIIILIAIMMVLKLIGIETTGLLAVIGAAGFAIGLALQGTLSDIASGILLAVFQVYTIGEIIEVDGIKGRVQDFTMFQTVLLDTATNSVITVPNRKIQEGIVKNHSRQKKVYIMIQVLVSNTNKDYPGIIQVITDSVKNSPDVISPEEIGANVSDMSKAGTTITVRIPIRSVSYPGATGGMMTAIREGLAKNNIQMLDCTTSCEK